jgi:hypothetical protein
MLLQTLGASSARDAALRILSALVALWLSLFLFVVLLLQYTNARFWEPYVKDGGPIVIVGPVIVIALLAGAIPGAFLGIIFRRYATRVAALAGLLNMGWGAVLYFEGAMDLTTAITLAIGLLLGGYTVALMRQKSRGRS